MTENQQKTYYQPRLLVILALLLSFTTCKTTQQSKHLTPAETCEKFFTAFSNQDYEAAKALGTESTARIISVIQTLSEMAGGVNITSDNKKELLNCEEKEGQAICKYKAFSGPVEEVFLVRVKGKWLVEMKVEKSINIP